MQFIPLELIGEWQMFDCCLIKLQNSKYIYPMDLYWWYKHFIENVSLVNLKNGSYHTFESKCFYERNRSLKMFVFIVHTFKLDRFHQSVNLFKTSLLTVLHFDDFKFVYQIGGTMNFIILNVQTRKLFSTLFSCFPLSVRKI